MSLLGFDKGLSRERRLIAVLFAVCGVLIGAGLGVSRLAGEPSHRTVALGDVSEAHIVEIHDAEGNVVLSGEFRSRVDALGNTEKDAPLRDSRGRTVIGEIEIEVPAPGRENRRPELEVDIISLPPRQTFSIVVDGRVVASFTTDDRGSIDMELQEGEVPPFGM